MYYNKKKSYSLTLDPDVMEQVEELADMEFRSLSQTINLILRKHFNKTNESDPNKKHAAE